MVILINASNLKKGGGLQVADSICSQLYKYPQYNFVVVLSEQLKRLGERIGKYDNVMVYVYNIEDSIYSLLFGRNKYLDSLVTKHRVECVLTIFGPSRWKPKVPHIQGFARPHIVLQNSPFFKQLSLIEKLKLRLKLKLIELTFKRDSDNFYTENPFISMLLKHKWPHKEISTITNYYNQIFDNKDNWVNRVIPKFDGITILTITANYPHKNLKIAIDIARILKVRVPELKFRFLYTINKEDLTIPDDLRNNFLLIGKVDIEECPYLYTLSDISFQPSLLECFSATYAESMRMRVPIVTVDMDFAHGLCGNAALYYSPLDAQDAANNILKLINDSNLRQRLIREGEIRLLEFDNYNQRLQKLLYLCEQALSYKS